MTTPSATGASHAPDCRYAAATGPHPLDYQRCPRCRYRLAHGSWPLAAVILADATPADAMTEAAMLIGALRWQAANDDGVSDASRPYLEALADRIEARMHSGAIPAFERRA